MNDLQDKVLDDQKSDYADLESLLDAAKSSEFNLSDGFTEEKKEFEKLDWKNSIFEALGGRNWEEKPSGNRSKIEAKIECVPGSIFDGILMDLGSQFGVGNQPKIDPWPQKGRQEAIFYRFFSRKAFFSLLGLIFHRFLVKY